MSKTTTVVSIPLYPGVKGSLLEAPWTQKGTEVTEKIYWVTPREVAWPDGWNIFNIEVTPTYLAYTGILEFELWDKYKLAVPKYMGKVKINSADDTYEVQLEQRYHGYRLTAMFILTHSPRQPEE